MSRPLLPRSDTQGSSGGFPEQATMDIDVIE
jgi:hypothetical protein